MTKNNKMMKDLFPSFVVKFFIFSFFPFLIFFGCHVIFHLTQNGQVTCIESLKSLYFRQTTLKVT